MQYVLPSPLLGGVSVQLPWATIDQGPSASGGQYQWTNFDNSIQPFIAAGKLVNLVVWPICEPGANQVCGGNPATPAYVLNSPGLAFCTGGGGTMPVPYSSPFKTAYEQFIANVVSHYANNPSIGYIRFGFSRGGEVFPWCASALASSLKLSVSQWRDTYWLPYDKEMNDYIKSLNPTMPIVAPVTAGTPVTDYTWPNTEASQGVADGFGFGNQGLQKGDIAAYYAGTPTNANWAALFNNYFSSTTALELQTLGPSDAAGTLNDGSNQAMTGPLPPLLTFAVQRHATVIELYAQDWELALVPGYVNNLGQSNAQYGAAYVGAMEQALGRSSVSLSLNNVNFPNQLVSTSSMVQSAQLTNTGSYAINISSVTISGDFVLATTPTSCPYGGGTLAVASSCTLDITFSPTQAGNRPGAVTINDSDPGSPQMVSLLGTGVLTTSSLVFSRSDITVGSSPQAVITGDFNGDGKPDLAVANAADNTVSIFLGIGDGTFALQSTVMVGTMPSSLASADFNADGYLDLAVTNSGDNTVTILTGNGDGTFTAGSTIPVGSNPVGVIAGDWNGDGKADLAIVNYNDGTITVMLGNGDGTFNALQPISVGNGPDSLQSGDFNGDGKLDLAIANKIDGSVVVLLGNGDGTFNLSATLTVGSTPSSVALGDLNSDGFLDLAVANAGSNNISVFLGNGDGTFQTQTATTYVVGNSPQAVAASDLNGDGRLDLIAVNAVDNTFSILPGNGDGTFANVLVFPTGSQPDAFCINDFNGDGHLDVAVAATAINKVSLHLQTGQAAFSATALNFGSQPVSTTSLGQQTTVVNTGSASFTVDSAIITGANSGDFAVTNCATLPTNVSPGNPCAFSVTFSPSTANSETASLVISINKGQIQQAISLSGTGTQPSLWLNTSSLSFGTQPLNTSSTQSVQLTNLGNAPVSISAINTTGDFSLTTTPQSCSYTGGILSVGASCTADVTFTPSQVGSRTGVLSISDNVGSGSQSVSLSGTGGSVTTTTIASSLNPSLVQQQVSFTANVSASGGTPAGTVNFSDAGNPLGSAAMSGGIAVFATSALAAGSHSVTASYSGNATFLGSSSPVLTQNVLFPTSVVVSSNPEPSTYGQAVTFVATVSSTGGLATGSVRFKRGTVTLGTGTLANGVATYTTTSTQLLGGTDIITAMYLGDSTHATSTSANFSQSVNKAATTMTLSSTQLAPNHGQSVTFTAKVTAAPGTPTGSVVFKRIKGTVTTTLATVALSGGVASYSTSFPAAGTYTVKATYQGSTNYLTNNSSIVESVH
jgi:hypothetical protein